MDTHALRIVARPANSNAMAAITTEPGFASISSVTNPDVERGALRQNEVREAQDDTDRDQRNTPLREIPGGLVAVPP